MNILIFFILITIQFGQAVASESYDELFKMSISNQPNSLDPQFDFLIANHEVNRHIYDPLFEIDSKGEFFPVLVESYVAESPTRWILTLKKNIKFHDGDELTSEDVIATFDRVRRAGKQGSYYNAFRASGYKAINRYQFEMTAENPEPEFLKTLNVFYIVKKEAAQYGRDEFDSGRLAVGTGPYYLVSHNKEKFNSFLLKANENYHQKPAYLKNVEISVLLNKEDRVSAFLKKDIDFTGGLTYLDIKSVLESRSAKITTPKADRVFSLQVNFLDDQLDYIRDNNDIVMSQNPLKDLRVRQAISLSIDRQALTERVFGSSDIDATPTRQLMPEGYIGHISWAKVGKQDLSKSRELLKEAGYPDGFKLAMVGKKGTKEIASIISEMISKSGITAEVVLIEDTQSISEIERSKFPLKIYFGKAIDPLKALRSVDKYNNPEFKDLLGAANATFDPRVRKRKIERAAIMVLDDLPIIPLFFRNNVWAIRSDMVFLSLLGTQLTLAYEVVPAQ